MKWKLVLSIGIGITLMSGGAWFWLQSSPKNEPLVFENTALKTQETAEQYDSVQEKAAAIHQDIQTIDTSRELSPQEHETPSTQVLPPAPPAPETSLLPSAPSITDHLLGFGFRTPPSPRVINTIVLHSSYNASGGDAYNFDKIIGQYEQYGVGAHYIIDRGGKIYQLVRESNIAYHAGESKMPDGRKNVNDFSIGIELIGTEDSSFTEKEYTALNDLIADIKTRHKIKDIVGHSDIAPTRKTDPWKFDWKKLK